MIGLNGDGLFRPEQSITKAELLKVVLNSKGINVSNVQATSSEFNLDENSWYKNFVLKANEMGLLDNENKSLEPEAMVERALACEYLYDIAEFNE